MKILTLIACIILIVAMLGYKKKDEVNRLIKQNFNNELIVKKIAKRYPLEPLKKWEGLYIIILTDKIDKEDFAVFYQDTDKLEKVLEEVRLSREIKNKFIKKQKIAVKNIKKVFTEPFIQMFEIETSFNSLSSPIKFFLEKKVFKENKEDIIIDFLIKVNKNIINTYNSVYISCGDEYLKKEKNYYGYIEDGFFYRMNEQSFGSNADFYISKVKFDSPMYGLDEKIREKFMGLNDKIFNNNYFYKKYFDILEKRKFGCYMNNTKWENFISTLEKND